MIIALVVSITQIFNIPVLRVTRSGNEISPEDINVTFDDVKGVDEAKAELQVKAAMTTMIHTRVENDVAETLTTILFLL